MDMKVGRNDLCPCGSGRKFKKCHLDMPPLEALRPPHQSRRVPQSFIRKMEKERREEEVRVKTFGNIRPIIHVPDYAGYQIVVVRNRIYYSKKWRFFTDFLPVYCKMVFGKEWLDQQNAAAPSGCHPLYTWQKQGYAFQQKQTPQPDGTYAEVPNGPLAACMNFYYDLYTVDDNSVLDKDLLNRLRHRDQFQGALHEVFTAATCLRAGYSIFPENEKDPSRRHAEFVAVHRVTGQHILVEAKSRHRAGVMGQAGVVNPRPDTKFQKLINDAISKDPNNPLAVFVDTNLPVERAKLFYTPQSTNPVTPSKAVAALIARIQKDASGVDPYNVLALSNHPQHYSEDDSAAPPNHWIAFMSQKARVPVYKPQAILDLMNAINLYGNIPTHFPPVRDGQITPDNGGAASIISC